MTPKTNLEAYNCVVGYNAQVDRRIVEYGMVQDVPTDRQKTGRDAKTATGDYGFLRSLYQSEGALAARWRSLRNFFHYPRYPWE